MSVRLGVYVVLLSTAGLAVCQTLYSAMRDEETTELHALKTTAKQLMEELRVIKEILPRKRSCPPDWYSFESSCYLINTNKKSYEEAAQSCIMRGSKLVEIETQQENSFLKRILNSAGNYWTGGTDSLDENKWVWPMTGKSFTFHNWPKGEPNDYDGIEDCMEIAHRYEWNDNAANTTFMFICEKNSVY